MGRIGFRLDQAEQVAELVKEHNELNCRGLYSHFPTADEISSSKIEKQVHIFDELRTHFDFHLVSHICNTAGITRGRKEHFDMVRAGIGLYGYAPGEVEIPGLISALSWETQLVQMNKIKKGETVSYGATWEAPENGFCGVIPVGYSDGIPRSLSGNFRVSILGEAYPVVGRVTMNYCIVYLGQSKIKNGTRVFLLNENCTAWTWAEATDTISYEILTSISPRIIRNYINS